MSMSHNKNQYDYIIIDTSIIDRVYKVDNSYSVIEWIIEGYSGKGIGDHAQISKTWNCPSLAHCIQDHGITDEEVILFTSRYQDMPRLRRLRDPREDPVDLKLLLFAQRHASSILVTGDKRLLYCAAEFNLKRSCFKAALHHTDEIFGQGTIYDNDSYNTEEMFEQLSFIVKRDPFFHYLDRSKCEQCHPKNDCPTIVNPPVKKQEVTA